MGTRKRWRRTDLFLVRVWRDLGFIAEIRMAGTIRDEGQVDHDVVRAWHGQVRRVYSGESRRFDNLDMLLDVLTDMLGGSGDRSQE